MTTLLERKIGEIAVVENSTQKFDCRLKPQFVRQLTLRLSGTLTVSGGTGVLTQDSPLGLIRQIRFTTTDGKLLKAFDPKNMNFLNKLELSTALPVLAPTTGAASGIPFNATIIVPFECWSALEPMATALNANNYSDFILYLDFAAVADIISLSSVLSAKVEIISVENKVDIEARFAKLLEMIDTEQMKTVSGSGVLEFDLPEDTEFKTLLLRVIDNGVRSSALVTNVKVDADNGNSVFRELPFVALQDSNKIDYEYETQDAGIAVIEFDPDGDLKDLLDTFRHKTPKLKVTCIAPTGVAQVHVLQRQIVTPS